MTSWLYRHFGKALLLFAVIALANCYQKKAEVPVVESQPGSERPNIVWIILDAARASNFSCYGYDRPTSPHLDELATNGILFEENFTQGIFTDISVPSYMTGRYFPVSIIGNPNQQRPRKRPDNERVLPEILRENGYFTIGISAHWGMFGGAGSGQALLETFDQFTAVKQSDDGLCSWCNPRYAQVDEVYAKVREHLQDELDRPFFMYVHLLDTHFPHCLPEEDVKWATLGYESEAIADGEPVDMKSIADGRPVDTQFTARDQQELQNLHDDSIHFADRYVGKIISAVQSAGYGDNTIFIIGSDHGDLLGEDGKSWGHESPYTATEELLRVPLIMAGPGIPKGARISKLTENADVVPTLVDLLDLKTDAAFDGVSLRPYLEGRTEEALHTYTYTRTHSFKDLLYHVIRTPQYKLLYKHLDGERHYYAVPDHLSEARKDAQVEADVADRLNAILENEILPKAEAYYLLEPLFTEIPLTANNQGALRFLNAEPVVLADQAIPPAEQQSDGQWTLSTEGLWAASWAEDPPPLELSVTMPNGVYSVALLWKTHTDAAGHPASSIRAKGPESSEFELLEMYPFHGIESRLYRGLGTCEVADSEAHFTFAPGDPEAWAKVDTLYFVPIGQSASEREEIEMQREQLEALGYIQ